MQMLLVAFSRRMCCSRVCSASRNAGRPSASTDTPTSRPGSVRLCSSRLARNAACGPPKPSGTPKRCAEPTTMSAPISPGGRSSAQREQVGGDRRRARPARAPRSMISVSSRSAPLAPGYCSSTPNSPSSRQVGRRDRRRRPRCRAARPASARPRSSADGSRRRRRTRRRPSARAGGTSPSPRPPRSPRRAATRSRGPSR